VIVCICLRWLGPRQVSRMLSVHMAPVGPRQQVMFFIQSILSEILGFIGGLLEPIIDGLTSFLFDLVPDFKLFLMPFDLDFMEPFFALVLDFKKFLEDLVNGLLTVTRETFSPVQELNAFVVAIKKSSHPYKTTFRETFAKNLSSVTVSFECNDGLFPFTSKYLFVGNVPPNTLVINPSSPSHNALIHLVGQQSFTSRVRCAKSTWLHILDFPATITPVAAPYQTRF
jgi:hypothetical protein